MREVLTPAPVIRDRGSKEASIRLEPEIDLTAADLELEKNDCLVVFMLGLFHKIRLTCIFHKFR